MFINLVLKKEQEVYRSEGVEWVHISFVDNAPIYKMIEVQLIVLYNYCGIVHISMDVKHSNVGPILLLFFNTMGLCSLMIAFYQPTLQI